MDEANALYTGNSLVEIFSSELLSKLQFQLPYEKEVFRCLGFCHITNFISVDKIDSLLNELSLIRQSHIDAYASFEENKEIKVLPYIDKVSDFYYDFTRHEVFRLLSEIFLNKKTTPLFCEYFNKPKLFGTFSPPHQDQAYYNDHFSDETALAFWIALDDATIDNGCLHYSTKHQDSLLPHLISNDVGFSKMLPSEDLSEYIPVIAKKGDCVIHHGLVPHFSGKNTSNGDRRAVVVNYRTSSFRQENW